jgi:FKBP-type peptidyl-prolyl cis-trans isomerase SlyD
MSRITKCFAAVLVLTVPLTAAAQTKSASAAPAIEKGSKVQLEFTLKDEAGAVLESNKGQPPLNFVQGNQELIPGLERELLGMHAGEEKKVVVKPEDGYGKIEPAALTEVPKDALPAQSLKVGTRLMARSSTGESRPVVVKEIKDKTVVLDLNHPFAGKTLYFDVKVLAVEAAKPLESKPGN